MLFWQQKLSLHFITTLFMADSKFYFPPSFGDLSIEKTVRPVDWRNDVSCQNGLKNLSKIGSNNYTNDVKAVRANFFRYFSSDVGAVPWQFYAVNNTLDDFGRQCINTITKKLIM